MSNLVEEKVEERLEEKVEEVVENFTYKYSATENEEIKEIRDRYLPKALSKLDELKALDAKVQRAGNTEAISVGVVGSLVFGTGMCLAMQVLGSGILTMVAGVIVGIIGMAIMMVAYPISKSKKAKMKEKLAPRILELTEELM